MKVKSESEVAQSCPTLRDRMDCSLPGSSVHYPGYILQWLNQEHDLLNPIRLSTRPCPGLTGKPYLWEEIRRPCSAILSPSRGLKVAHGWYWDLSMKPGQMQNESKEMKCGGKDPPGGETLPYCQYDLEMTLPTCLSFFICKIRMYLKWAPRVLSILFYGNEAFKILKSQVILT